MPPIINHSIIPWLSVGLGEGLILLDLAHGGGEARHAAVLLLLEPVHPEVEPASRNHAAVIVGGVVVAAATVAIVDVVVVVCVVGRDQGDVVSVNLEHLFLLGRARVLQARKNEKKGENESF